MAQVNIGGELFEKVVVVSTSGTDIAGGGGGGGGAVTLADGADVTTGARANTAATWYNTTATIVSLIKLQIAAALDAGSHVYGYNGSNQLTTDAWTLFGTTRTKTFGYTGDNLTSESDWV